MNGLYYKINEHQYLECLYDEQALKRYGNSKSRILITIVGEKQRHELITPTKVVKDE